MSIRHRYRMLVAIFAVLTACGSAVPAVARGDDSVLALRAEERQQLERGVRNLTGRLETLRGDNGKASTARLDRISDAEVFGKGIAWALRYDATFASADLKLLRAALERCQSRVAAVEAGKAPWAARKGKVVRGFVSAVDGSVQPYAVVVPATYNPSSPMRLDVVLHGSSQPVGMSELRFLGRFDEGDGPAANVPDVGYIELHPLGRVENGYRWAGETDVFEAIEATCRNYAIDQDRIVLRGMSMGASGTWHLGLKHPDRFVALGPYCGYVDTHEFSKTPLPNFVVVGRLPPHQEKTLHMFDSVDYAANAGMVPAVACMGEKDVFFQAHEIMGRAMANEGLAMVNLISPDTGHVLDPATHKEQMRRIGELARNGLEIAPGHIRFVTWTLKYSRCYWLQVLRMGEHHARAELEARMDSKGSVDVVDPKNITRFAILPPVAPLVKSVRVGGAAVFVPQRRAGPDSAGIVLGKRGGRWDYLGELGRLELDGKRPGLQGPIDDAFTAPFLCVRGTGAAWHPAVQTWAEASLKRFSDEWNRYFRGELPVKDDTAVTAEDARRFNLILFGDPGSNSWIARVLPRLPVTWTREECAVGDTRVPAVDHALVLVQPNPLAEGRYVVLNSGHTFHEKELATLNYLLFPRLGDWAVIKVPDDPSRLAAEDVVRGGFFDERWTPSVHADDRVGIDHRLIPYSRPPARFADDLGSFRSPLKFLDGSPVRNADDWGRRRQEILHTWHDLMGPWPKPLEKPVIQYLEEERREGFTQHHIRLEVAPGRTIDDAYLLLPEGHGPFPAVLVVFYDAGTGIGRGKPGRLDFALQLARRGFVTLSLGSDPADSYPDKEHPNLQPLSYHAYMASNCYNALANLPRIDPGRIGVMGHSYGGKWSMFASCLDDRFACGVWSDPGVVFDEARPNVNYWEPWYLGWEPSRRRNPGPPTAENPRTGAYRRLVEVGHDLHELHSLMAPRPLLVSGGSEDPPERWRALNHAFAVNRLLGYGDRVAMTNRAGHAPTAESNEQIYLFFEHFLKPSRGGEDSDRPRVK